MLALQDAKQLYTLTDQSRESLKEWLPFIDNNKSWTDTEAFIKSTMVQFSNNNGFQAGIWYEGNIAGVIGFHKIDWNNKSTSIGYWLGKGYEGSGIMTESVKAFMNHAFPN